MSLSPSKHQDDKDLPIQDQTPQACLQWSLAGQGTGDHPDRRSAHHVLELTADGAGEACGVHGAFRLATCWDAMAPIRCTAPSPSLSKVKRHGMLQELRKERPTIKLLYITPEQLVASASLTSALQALQSRGLLARFVVDEVTYLTRSFSSLPACAWQTDTLCSKS